MFPSAIFQIIILIFSVMAHEIAHGAVALRFGDETAKRAGRLTINPLKHIDPFGSVLLPLMLYIVSHGGTVFGWAKPVPVDQRNLKNPRRDMGLVAFAGPFTNLLIAAVVGVLSRIAIQFSFIEIVKPLQIVALVNIFLAVFNLIPIPPLDGSNILFSLLPDRFSYIKNFLARYGFFIFIAFIFFGFPLIEPLVWLIYRLFVG